MRQQAGRVRLCVARASDAVHGRGQDAAFAGDVRGIPGGNGKRAPPHQRDGRGGCLSRGGRSHGGGRRKLSRRRSQGGARRRQVAVHAQGRDAVLTAMSTLLERSATCRRKKSARRTRLRGAVTRAGGTRRYPKAEPARSAKARGGAWPARGRTRSR